MKKSRYLLLAVFLAVAPVAQADEVRVVAATATAGSGGWRFDVTLRHDDTGWENYADGWGVYTLDGVALGYRVLVHPHVDEQPFTRSLSGVIIPAGTRQVIIRPHDLVHGNGPDFVLDIP